MSQYIKGDSYTVKDRQGKIYLDRCSGSEWRTWKEENRNKFKIVRQTEHETSNMFRIIIVIDYIEDNKKD